MINKNKFVLFLLCIAIILKKKNLKQFFFVVKIFIKFFEYKNYNFWIYICLKQIFVSAIKPS